MEQPKDDWVMFDLVADRESEPATGELYYLPEHDGLGIPFMDYLIGNDDLLATMTIRQIALKFLSERK